MDELSGNLLAYLAKWHVTTITRKQEAGYIVDLPLSDFIALFEKRQLASLQRAIDEDRLRGLQDRDNPFAYVATWRSYAACSSGRYDKTTAIICSRMKSAALNKPQAGDKLRDSHKNSISKSMTGKTKSDDHRRAISEASKGVKKAPWDEERRARMSARRRKEEAVKRGGVT